MKQLRPVMVVVLGLLSGCAMVASSLVSVPDEQLASKYLQEQGYIDISITGWGGAGCPTGGNTNARLNHSSTAFSASTPAGRKATGKVCCARDKTCKVFEDRH